MSTSEETWFAMGVFVVIIVVSLGALVLHLTGDSESTPEKPAHASRQKNEQPRTSKAAKSNRSSRPVESNPKPVAIAARAAAPAPTVPALQSALTVAQPEPAVPVIDPVPLAYFDTPSDASQPPDVIEKYRNRVERGALFMARLEAIATDNAPVSSDVPSNLSMEFAARSQSKRLSYKSTHIAEWIEATFSSTASEAMRDVLVDVRRVGNSGAAGERVTLFFASIQDYADKRGFAMNADVGDSEVILRIYSLTDELAQLGEARLTPSNFLDR